MTNRNPTPETLLVDFIIHEYAKSPHHRSGKMPGRYVICKMLTLIEHLDEMLNRPPVVGDLNMANLTAIGEHLGRRLGYKRSTALNYRDSFKAAWRYAADLGLVPIEPSVAK